MAGKVTVFMPSSSKIGLLASYSAFVKNKKSLFQVMPHLTLVLRRALFFFVYSTSHAPSKLTLVFRPALYFRALAVP